MHTIEPFWKWRDIYNVANDELSPFFGKEYSEFEFSDIIYNYYIHPQWDSFDSQTLYLKIIYCNYQKQVVIIELIGEWNDCIENDIMFLKRNIIDTLLEHNIYKYIIIGEHVFEFFATNNEYYAEWHQDISEQLGYIVAVNFRNHIIEEMHQNNIQHYFSIIGNYEENPINWRQYKPQHFIAYIEQQLPKQIGTTYGTR